MSLPAGLPPTPVVLWRPAPSRLAATAPTTTDPAYFGGSDQALLKSEAEIEADLGPNATVWVVDDGAVGTFRGPVYPGYHAPVFGARGISLAVIEPAEGWNGGTDTMLACEVTPSPTFTIVRDFVRVPGGLETVGGWNRVLAALGPETGFGAWIMASISKVTFRAVLDDTTIVPLELDYELQEGTEYRLIAIGDSGSGELRIRIYERPSGELVASDSAAIGDAVGFDGGVYFGTALPHVWVSAYNADGNSSVAGDCGLLALYDRALTDEEADAFGAWTDGETDACLATQARLPQQFKQSENLKKLLCIYANQVQALIDVARQLRDERFEISVAEGVQLDGLGSNLGQLRHGLTDEVYRTLLNARVVASNGGVRPDDMIAVVREVFGEDFSVEYRDSPPACFVITIPEEIPDTVVGRLVGLMLKDAKPAGVHSILKFWGHSPAERFAFAGGTGAGFGVGHMGSAV